MDRSAAATILDWKEFEHFNLFVRRVGVLGWSLTHGRSPTFPSLPNTYLYPGFVTTVWNVAENAYAASGGDIFSCSV